MKTLDIRKKGEKMLLFTIFLTGPFTIDNLRKLSMDGLKIGLLIISSAILIGVLSWLNNKEGENISKIRKTLDLRKGLVKLSLSLLPIAFYLTIENLVTISGEPIILLFEISSRVIGAVVVIKILSWQDNKRRKKEVEKLKTS